MKQFAVTENDAGKLIKFIQKKARNMPDSLLQKALRKKRVKVNGARVTDGKFLLNIGDVVELFINDEFFAPVERACVWQKAKGELCVVYEDKDILIADKPAGVLCHEDDRENVQTLLNLARKHVGGDEGVALCHRLDRNTRGLVVIAKTTLALREMTAILRNRWVKKFYIAETEGTGDFDWVVEKAWLVRDLEKKQVRVYDKPGYDRKEIITKFRFIEENKVEIELVTGRTHQIRAHLAYLGFPLVGDAKYGNARGRSRQRLISNRLEFSGEIPEDFHLVYLRGKVFSI